ncbi:MAG: energy-dependent translational throttle protein EttA [Ekhidna sp.]|nr:energy-dependent translational throttle protein EttA [Ekhidna sp.]
MSDEKVIFSMSGINKIYPPQKQILKNIHLSFFYGAKIGVLGLNGAGKSSLLRIIAGVDKEYQGKVAFSPGFTVGMLDQEPRLDPDKTVIEVVKEGIKEINDLLKEYDEINAGFASHEVLENIDKMNKLIERQGEVQEQLDAAGAWEIDHKLQRAMDALRTPPEDAVIKHLSGGEKRRVALCRLLLEQPDILLLDEPTNHLDAESVLWLEQHLQQYKGTIIAVTHDRYFLDNVAGWILELDRGEGIPWEGNYSSWLEQKQKRLAQEEKQESKRQRTLQRELEWVRMSQKARQAKGKARLNAYDKLMSREGKERERNLELYIPPGPRLGTKVIEVNGVSKTFGETLLFEDLSFNLPQGGIVGVIGPNGAGKSTLFKLIAGNEAPDSGSFEVGKTVEMSYIDQEHNRLDPEKTVFQVIAEGNEIIDLGGREMNARAYVSKFNFTGPDQEKQVSKLSGGERNRVHLALTLKKSSNLILLDEPTNDLDVNTLRALEEALENFAGCAVVISHDRWFLDRIATHILAFEGDSQVYWFEGNFTDYQENRKKRLGEEALTKTKYKKLMA